MRSVLVCVVPLNLQIEVISWNWMLIFYDTEHYLRFVFFMSLGCHNFMFITSLNRCRTEIRLKLTFLLITVRSEFYVDVLVYFLFKLMYLIILAPNSRKVRCVRHTLLHHH